jgi:hypothetical protein
LNGAVVLIAGARSFQRVSDGLESVEQSVVELTRGQEAVSKNVADLTTEQRRINGTVARIEANGCSSWAQVHKDGVRAHANADALRAYEDAAQAH